MAARQNKKKPDVKKAVKQEAIVIESPPIEPVDNTDKKDVVLREFLESLLPSITVVSETNKSFAKLIFCNSNSYCGWLGPNGFNGFGTYKFADGSSFRGSFERSLTRGLGRYTYIKGSMYEGEFLAGCRHGYGHYKTTRFQYDGYFKNGRFHGQGVWKSRTGEQRGIFHKGNIMHGEVHDSSGVFKGTFDESALRKKGKLTFKNGNTYSGSWLDDLFWGFGVYNWINEGDPATKAETKYVGYWLNGKRHGLGMQTFRRRYIICQWDCDRKSGAGVIVACNGSCYASTIMFIDNQYKGSYRIKQCKESRDILLHLMKLTTPDNVDDTMEDMRDALMVKIRELLKDYGERYCPVYPIHVPHYEIVDIPREPYNTCSELKHLQQVLTENYKVFWDLYRNYTHPADDYMNNLSLNLFYMDVFHKVQDVNVSECMDSGNLEIRHQCIYSDQKDSCCSPLAPVPFYEFFQHFLHITEVLMANEELKLAAERFKPTFFGHLAIQVLSVLKMLQASKVTPFLVREGIQVNRSALLNLLRSMKQQSPGDKTIRTSYRYLNMKGLVSGRSKTFIKAVDWCLENVFQDGVMRDSEIQVSDLESIEIVLYTCQLNLAKEDMKKNKELLKQMKKTIIKEL